MLRVVTSRLARTRRVRSQEGGGQAGLRLQIECTQRKFLGSARTATSCSWGALEQLQLAASSVVVVHTPMGCKSTRDLKELSAGKEHTNEVQGGGRDPGVRRPGAGLS